MQKLRLLAATLLIPITALAMAGPVMAAPPPQNPQTGSVGLQGEIPANPPTQGATITVPGNGQNFTTIPITVAGSCPNGLLVEIYKNNVFAGSTNCNGGSFSLQIDLFDGKNDLVARVYDNLNQPGPDSNTVSVNFNANKPSPGPRIFLTSAYAKRGALPGSSLSWPITLSGGVGPYAISIDWGDKSTPDLISRSTAGDLTVDHVYKQSGIFVVIMKATDVNGEVAFLQVVGVGNGPIQQASTSSSNNTNVITKVIWWPLLVALIMIIIAFWLGRRNKVEEIRTKLRKGLKPF
jgi:hypothetical protein